MRDEQKSVTFNAGELDRIELAAKKYGLSYAAFIRSACLKEADKILGAKDNE